MDIILLNRTIEDLEEIFLIVWPFSALRKKTYLLKFLVLLKLKRKRQSSIGKVLQIKKVNLRLTKEISKVSRLYCNSVNKPKTEKFRR